MRDQTETTREQAALGYVLIETKDGERAIKCLTCSLISHNRNDIDCRFCGHCRCFHHEDLRTWDEQSRDMISKLSIR